MKPGQTYSGGYDRDYYNDQEYMYDDDTDYIPPARKKPSVNGGKERSVAPKRPVAQGTSPPPGAGGQAISPGKAVRARPTNNQLLYKAYFRWSHYPHKLKTQNLPVDTDACASVTAAFLQVLQIMQTAEQLRTSGGSKRNILQILSSNTRRTKVVELSSGTHRVPDELKKHYLSDGEGGQYSTNLDRNRYGNDDNYLFTVIRYDLEFLGLCPCMVDVEIIDAKQGNSSIIVSAGTEVCTCQGGPPAADPVPAAHAHGHGQANYGPPARHGGGGGGSASACSGGSAGHAAAAAPAHGHGMGGRGMKAEYPPAAANPGPVLPPVSYPPVPPVHEQRGLERVPVERSLLERVAPERLERGPSAERGGGGGGGALGAERPDRSERPERPERPDRPERPERPERAERGGGVAAGTHAAQAHADAGHIAPMFGSGTFRGGLGLGGPVGRESPKRSGTSVSQLFDALVMAATGGAEGAAAAGGLGGEPPVTSPAHADRPERAGGGATPVGGLSSLGTAGAIFGSGGGGGGGRAHGPPGRNKSKLWSLNNLSYGGEVDSLQNALDAFREQDEIASGEPFLASGGVAGPDGSMQRSDSLRQRRRKPLRNSSILGRPASSGGVVIGGSKLAMNLREKSDDNLKLDPELALGCFPGMGPMGGLGAAPGPAVSSLASGEDDNDALAAKGEELGAEGAEGGAEGGGEAGGPGEEEGGGVGPGAGGPGAGGGGRGSFRHHVRHVPRQSSVANLAPRVAHSGAGAGGVAGGGGPGGGLALGPGGLPALGGSASAAIASDQLRRLANELESMKQENRNLRQQLQRQSSTTAAGLPAVAPIAANGVTGSPGGARGGQAAAGSQAEESARLRKLETELSSMRTELMGLAGAKRSTEDENAKLKRELLLAQQNMNALLARIVGGGPAPLAAAPGAAAAAPGAALAGLLGVAPPAVAAEATAAPQMAAASLLGAAAGAIDPSCFTAHFAALQAAGRAPTPGAAAAGAGASSPDGTLGSGSSVEVSIAGGVAAAANGASVAGATQAAAPADAVLSVLGKRSADQAGLEQAAGAAAKAPAQPQAQQAAQEHQPLASMPTFSPDAFLGGAHQSEQAQQLQPQPAAMHHQPQQQQQPYLPPQAPSGVADSQQTGGAIATPADSGFSDVMQLLGSDAQLATLPNLDSGFLSSPDPLGLGGIGLAGMGLGGMGGAAGSSAAVSGPTGVAAGPGTGSGSASVPQMPVPMLYGQTAM